MSREALDRFATAALYRLMCALAAARELAWLNRRMTGKGVALAVALVAAHYGLNVSPETQTAMAAVFTLYLGLAGRDKPTRNFR